MLKGKHLIAGNWVDGQGDFANTPLTGDADRFSNGTVEVVGDAVEAAEEAFSSFAYSSRSDRAAFLRAIADEIEALGSEITAMGMKETGLPQARLEGERGRTTGQLRLFADHIEKGDFLDRRFDEALPDRAPLPRPDIRVIQRPIGPVAIFGASNFPLAFSTAGGDTVAALAAGCPVVVKGHPAHPGVCDLVAQAFANAIEKSDVHPGVFNQVQGGDHAIGGALVQHPLIKAVGFTGSLRAGRALFDQCAARSEPIPFFGELGSINPMFLLPEASRARGAEIGAGWAGSLTMGAGQFCTNPGIAIVLDGAAPFVDAAKSALSEASPQVMLTDAIALAYGSGAAEIKKTKGVRCLLETTSGGRTASPNLFEVDGADWLENENLHEEVFGPLAIVVHAENLDQMHEIAKGLKGQLTCTLHMDDGDLEAAQSLMPVLERKAGRLLANGFPTGVEVSDAMVHGGPYPASTNFGATSVGTLSIRRFLRPVSFQNIPQAALPIDLA